MQMTTRGFPVAVLLIGLFVLGFHDSSFAQKPDTPGFRAGPPSPSGVSIEPGYFMDAVVEGLDFPTAVAHSNEKTWISEAGLGKLVPKVKEVDFQGNVNTVLSAEALSSGTLLSPLTDVTYHEGWLWISHRQEGVNGWHVGAISKFDPDDPAGTFTTLVTNLPASGDHHSNEIIFDESGRAYFSQGTATNSSVVGLDNFKITRWLDNFPEFHDFPARDVRLSGAEFTTRNPLTSDPDDQATTGPFMPFDSGPVSEGTLVEGASPSSPQNGIIAGNGTVYSFDPTASSPPETMRLEAWGLRNPYGIGLDPFASGVLFISNNGADIRGVVGERTPEEDLRVLGSRPIASDWDDLYKIEVGGEEEFFGWPDYFHDPETGKVRPVTDDLFCTSDVADLECPKQFMWDDQFRNTLDPRSAFSQFKIHSSANKFDFATAKKFKNVGDLFVAETGSFVPVTGAERFTGYRVVRVDRETGDVEPFIENTGETPEEVFDPNRFNKPIDVKFRGEKMAIVDFGVFEPALGFSKPGTGKVWLVSHGRSGIVQAKGRSQESATARPKEADTQVHNRPNPVDESTVIRFELEEATRTELVVYNVTGQVVSRLVDEVLPAGEHSVKWTAEDLPSGVYFYRLSAGRINETNKMMVVK